MKLAPPWTTISPASIHFNPEPIPEDRWQERDCWVSAMARLGIGRAGEPQSRNLNRPDEEMLVIRVTVSLERRSQTRQLIGGMLLTRDLMLALATPGAEWDATQDSSCG